MNLLEYETKKAPPPEALREREFVNRIRREIRAGFGIVPFIGSGLSAASGILMGKEFTDYLTWTVYLCVAGEGRDRDRRWDLRRQGWPKSPADGEVAAAGKWVADEFKKLCADKYKIQISIIPDGSRQTVELMGFDKGQSETDRTVAAMRRPLIPRILYGAKTAVNDDELRAFWQIFGDESHGKGWRLPPGASPTSEEHVKEAALRCLHDWRATLDFLSRLRQIQCAADDQPRLVITEEADQSIIDKFNLHITRGRRPNLAHSMLCHLAGPARIRTILTTNFDCLIEEAFADLDEHFEVIPVSVAGALPHPGTVHSLNCVIKMHGALTETRADYSLDDPPSEEDKRRFFNYVRGCDPYEHDPGFVPSHLLVAGYSGSDVRCVQMIKFLLDLDPTVKVFWICFGDSGHDALWKSIFTEDEYRVRDHEHDGLGDRVITVISRRPDLLFYELYQQLMLCLPRGGFTYQLSPNMPPGRDYRGGAESDNETLVDDKDNILNALRSIDSADGEEATADGGNHSATAKRYVVVDAVSGTTSPLRRAFHEATSTMFRSGIWLELEDYLNVPHLAHEILQTIAVSIGRFQLDHATVVPMGDEENGGEAVSAAQSWLETWKRHCRLMFDTWGFRPGSTLIVLYARNGPGGCSGWAQSYWPPLVADAKAGHATGACSLVDFVSNLAEMGFRVVYAPYSERRFERDQRKEESIAERARSLKLPERDHRFFFEESGAEPDYDDPKGEFRISRGQLFVNGSPNLDREAILAVESTPTDHGKEVLCNYRPDPARYTYEKILDKLMRGWIKAEDVKSSPANTRSRFFRRVFLYGCTLFRQSRHYAAFFTDAVIGCPERFNPEGVDNDWLRLSQLQHCLEELNGIRVFHRKPGGFAWMHRDLRLGIRHLLESAEPTLLDGNDKQRCIGRMRQLCASSHYWIADWYTKAFQTTGHAVPLLEALYHFAQCARFAPEAARVTERGDYLAHKGGRKWFDPYIARLRYRRGLWRIAILRLLKNLLIGRPVLKLWLEKPVAISWFGLSGEKEFSPLIQPGACSVLEALDESVVALQTQSDIAALAHPDALARSQIEECEKHRNRLSSEWERFRPLLEHELRSVVRASSDLLVYTSPENKSEGDGVFDIDDKDSKPWYRAADFEGLEVKDDKCWFEGVIGSLEAAAECAPGKEGEFIAALSKMLGEFFAPRTDNFLDLHLGSRDFQIEASLIIDDIPPRLVEMIAGLAYLWIRRAKLLEHAEKLKRAAKHDSEPPDNTEEVLGHPHPRKIGRMWVQACALCRLVVDFTAHMHPRHLQAEARLRIKMSALYGVSLGRVNRFFEAHRRINEASALLSKENPFRDSPPLAILEIRRAEVHILEARLIGRIAHFFSKWDADWTNSMSTTDAGGGIFLSEEFKWELCSMAFVRGLGIKDTIKGLYDCKSGDKKELREKILELASKGSRKTDSKKTKLKVEEAAARRVRVARESWLLLHLRRRPEEEAFQEARLDEGYPPADSKKRLYRLHITKLDEAWMALEKAERLLSGTSQASLWWSRLHALQLRVFAEHEFLDREDAALEDLVESDIFRWSLAFRRKQSHAHYVRDLFQRGLCAAPGNLYRFTRLLDYFLPAHRHALIADEFLRDPNFSLQKAIQSHKNEVKALLARAKKTWCPTMFKKFENRRKRQPAKAASKEGHDLLSTYCEYVNKRYVELFPAEEPDQDSDRGAQTKKPKSSDRTRRNQ